jgi:hypothetical protein
MPLVTLNIRNQKVHVTVSHKPADELPQRPLIRPPRFRPLSFEVVQKGLKMSIQILSGKTDAFGWCRGHAGAGCNNRI